MHELSFRGVTNFRDIGGHVGLDGRLVRSGRVFRSGHLGTATDDDIALLTRLGIRSAIDYRAPAEIDREGADRLPAGAVVHAVPMGNPAGSANDLATILARGDLVELATLFSDGRAHAEMASRTAAAATDRAAGHGQVLRLLADHEQLPAVVHCSAGKDRTGVAIAFLLTLLGVEREAVVEDYLRSNQARAAALAERLATIPESHHEIFLAFGEVRADYLTATFAAIDERHGSFTAYAHRPDGLGLDDATVERLRTSLLE